VGGLESLKRELREAVEWPFKYGDLLRHAGLGAWAAPGGATARPAVTRAYAMQTDAHATVMDDEARKHLFGDPGKR